LRCWCGAARAAGDPQGALQRIIERIAERDGPSGDA